MLKYSIKSLMQDRSKLLLSIFGVAIAIVLILVMDGIFAGSKEQLTAYINNTEADVFVLQDGVKNMHMAKSVIPASYKNEIEKINGVNKVTPINYVSINVKINGKNIPSYLIGSDPNQIIGGPWTIIEGTSKLKKNEVVIDNVIAKKYNLKLEDKIKIIGQNYKIVGMTEGTFSMVSSIFFFDIKALQSKLPAKTFSYLLVQKEKGASSVNIAKKINSKLSGANAMTKREFANNERIIAGKMGVEIIGIMTIISILAAIAVLGLSIYSATLEKVRDFGVLKAIGASKTKLYAVVISQALFSTILAIIIGISLSIGLSILLKVMSSEVLLVVTTASIAKAIIIALFVAVVAAYLPVKQISSVDPAIVFKS